MKKQADDIANEIQQFAGVKHELQKYGLKFGDVASFVKTVKEADQLGYDAQLIGSKLAYWDELKKQETDLALSLLELKGEKEAGEHKKNLLKLSRNIYALMDFQLLKLHLHPVILIRIPSPKL